MKAFAALATATGLMASGYLAYFNGSNNAVLEGTLEEQSAFLQHMAQYQRTYSNLEEMKMRFANFKENLKYINEENTKGHTYELGTNQFSDWSFEEYKAILGARVPADAPEMVQSDLDIHFEDVEGKYPRNVDWRDESNSNSKVPIVCPIQNQGQCGSCYSFSASGAISQRANQLGIFTSCDQFISEQWVVDCKLCGGCNGGW